MNNITPMKTHIDVVHGHLLPKRKLKLTNIVVINHFDINHIWQPGKKKVAPFGSTIIAFFNSTNSYKHGDEANNGFWKIWSFTSIKDTSICEHAKTSRCGG
jgi:hypothetical protein